MVGGALVRRLASEGCEVLTADRDRRPDQPGPDPRLGRGQDRPDAVFLAAAKVGGILANDTYPADFLYDNLMIEANVIEAARSASSQAAVPRLVLHLSQAGPQPIVRGRAADRAARADQRMVRHRQDRRHQALPGLSRQYGCDFISAMPTNLYGPGDNFDLQSSHVMPALMRKAHEAKARRRAGDRPSGARARRCASSCMSTTAPTPACS
jgi:GDP-L-fucose synthase